MASSQSSALVPKSAEQQLREKIAEELDKLGGMVSGEDTMRYEGEGFTFPKAMEGDLDGVINHLVEVREAEETKVSFERTFHYRPFDGAVAFSKAMSRLFGSQGIGKATYTMFGRIPPKIQMVETGWQQHTEAPWGKVGFNALNGTFNIGAANTTEWGICSHISIEAPRKYRRRIEGFFDYIQGILDNESIYRGQAINGAGDPGFINPYTVNPDSVFYSAKVMQQLEANIWAPIRYSDKMREAGISLKRAVLLEGPYGSGKSLAGLLTAQVAVQNGWTYILVRADDDPFAALRTAKMYAPAVVMIEDLDILTANKSREEIVKLLDMLDSVSVKNAEVLAVFTTNFLSAIDMGVLRPGRIDAVVRIDYLDSTGVEKLVRSVIPATQLAADINFASIARAFDGFLPAFAVETSRRAFQYNLAANNGVPGMISEEDLLAAAEGMQAQRQIMQEASEAGQFQPNLDYLIARKIADVFRKTSWNDMNFEVEDITPADAH